MWVKAITSNSEGPVSLGVWWWFWTELSCWNSADCITASFPLRKWPNSTGKSMLRQVFFFNSQQNGNLTQVENQFKEAISLHQAGCKFHKHDGSWRPEGCTGDGVVSLVTTWRGQFPGAAVASIIHLNIVLTTSSFVSDISFKQLVTFATAAVYIILVHSLSVI